MCLLERCRKYPDLSDYQLALKYFLRAVEMQTDATKPESTGSKNTRSWWGVKLVSRVHAELVITADATSR